MQISFTEIKIEGLTPDIDELISFLTSERWDYHSLPQIPEEKIKQQVAGNYFAGRGVKSFWILADDRKIGLLRLFDLGDANSSTETPLFDIKIKRDFRRNGIGSAAVKWLTSYVFTNYPQKSRFEATTRVDNLAMRKVLEKCGFVKEAHYRQAWPDENGIKYDCAGYAILKCDWENNKTTEVEFDN